MTSPSRKRWYQRRALAYFGWLKKHVRSLDEVEREANAIRDRVLAGTEDDAHATFLFQMLRVWLRRKKRSKWSQTLAN